MPIVITSFKEAEKTTGIKYSIASFQPTGYNYSQLTFLAPVNDTGARIFLSEYAPEQFRQELEGAYQSRWARISSWLSSLNDNEHVLLCCWCPFSQPAKEQIKKYGFFYCHGGLVALMIQQHRPDITLILGNKHQKLLHGGWRPASVNCDNKTKYDEILF